MHEEGAALAIVKVDKVREVGIWFPGQGHKILLHPAIFFYQLHCVTIWEQVPAAEPLGGDGCDFWLWLWLTNSARPSGLRAHLWPVSTSTSSGRILGLGGQWRRLFESCKLTRQKMRMLSRRAQSHRNEWAWHTHSCSCETLASNMHRIRAMQVRGSTFYICFTGKYTKECFVNMRAKDKPPHRKSQKKVRAL